MSFVSLFIWRLSLSLSLPALNCLTAAAAAAVGSSLFHSPRVALVELCVEHMFDLSVTTGVLADQVMGLAYYCLLSHQSGPFSSSAFSSESISICLRKTAKKGTLKGQRRPGATGKARSSTRLAGQQGQARPPSSSVPASGRIVLQSFRCISFFNNKSPSLSFPLLPLASSQWSCQLLQLLPFEACQYCSCELIL